MPARVGDRLRWAVLVFDLEPVRGHEQGGRRRALVVSYEPLHASGMATVCPITAARSEPRFPREVAIPNGVAGQTKDGVILCHQVRTVSLQRVGGNPPSIAGYVIDAHIRDEVRSELAVHLGLDIGGFGDGASTSRRYE